AADFAMGFGLIIAVFVQATAVLAVVKVFEGTTEEGIIARTTARIIPVREFVELFGLGKKVLAFALQRGGARGGHGAIEIFFALDPRLLADRERVQWRPRPDHEIAVLPGLERSDVAVNAKLLRRIDRDELERLLFGDAAELHGLGRLGVEPSRKVVGVRVDGHQHAMIVHQRGVVRDGVDDLVFVGPPIREGGNAHTVCGNFVGDLIPLEPVLKRAEMHTELLKQHHQHEHLVLAIGMAMNHPLAFEDFAERFQFQVAARRRTTGFPVIGQALRYCRAGTKRLAMNVCTPMRVWGKRVTYLSPQLDCFTFSPSANLMSGGASANLSPCGVSPSRNLITWHWPPMGLAEPCSRLATVSPPASSS